MNGWSGHYDALLRQAQRRARRADEAEDLLQSVLLAAIQAGRADLTRPDNRRWISGALRRRAAFDARSAARRLRREAASVTATEGAIDPAPCDTPLQDLSPALRLVMLLALSGHDKAEIASLLRISDAALRQRIAALRRLLRGQRMPLATGPRGALAFGPIRRALRPTLRHSGAALGSHDPDGHLFVLGSQNLPLRQLNGTDNTHKE